LFELIHDVPEMGGNKGHIVPSGKAIGSPICCVPPLLQRSAGLIIACCKPARRSNCYLCTLIQFDPIDQPGDPQGAAAHSQGHRPRQVIAERYHAHCVYQSPISTPNWNPAENKDSDRK
jgi:hypothetical protein